MFVLRRLPAFLALLMLGALLLRMGLAFPLGVAMTLGLLVLLLIPRAIPQTIASSALWGGCLAWVGMACLRVNEHLTTGLPWRRLILIFGAVTLFTASSAWLLQAKKGQPEDKKPGQD